MNEGTILLSAVGFLVVFVLVFLLTREFWCWYWKINRVVSLLEESNSIQRALAVQSGVEFETPQVTAVGAREPDGDPSLGPMVCPQCGGEFRAGYATCSQCEIPLVPSSE